MKKFEVCFGKTILSFENASGQPFDREVKTIEDIMHFYNDIVIYMQYEDEGKRFEMFRSSPPDESIVENLDCYIKSIIKTTKGESQYEIYEHDGFYRKTWKSFYAMNGVGFSPSVRILKEQFEVKQSDEEKASEFTSYDITFTDGLMGDGVAYVMTGLSEEGLLEIGNIANEFVDDFIENYYKKETE